MTTLIPTDWTDELKSRIIRDSHFTKDEHARRIKKMCGSCNCVGYNKYHTCIHTAECTFEFLEGEGELLPDAETVDVEINGWHWGVYLLYLKPYGMG